MPATKAFNPRRVAVGLLPATLLLASSAEPAERTTTLRLKPAQTDYDVMRLALRGLHQRVNANFTAHGKMSEHEANVQLGMLSELYTTEMKGQIRRVAEPEMKASCESQYAEQSLDSPAMDFVALTAQLDAGKSKAMAKAKPAVLPKP